MCTERNTDEVQILLWDVNLGSLCVILDHVPELGPDCLYVQMTEADGLAMTYWADPTNLVRVSSNSKRAA